MGSGDGGRRGMPSARKGQAGWWVPPGENKVAARGDAVMPRNGVGRTVPFRGCSERSVEPTSRRGTVTGGAASETRGSHGIGRTVRKEWTVEGLTTPRDAGR